MKIDINDYEYKEIIKNIITNREFKKLETCPHHKSNRLEHSKRVSYYSYKVCKILKIYSKAKHYGKYKHPGEESIKYPNLINNNWNTTRPFEKITSLFVINTSSQSSSRAFFIPILLPAEYPALFLL